MFVFYVGEAQESVEYSKKHYIKDALEEHLSYLAKESLNLEMIYALENYTFWCYLKLSISSKNSNFQRPQ